MDHPDLFGAPPGPPGLLYRPDFLSIGEEKALLDQMAGLDFRPFEYGPFTGARETLSFGWSYRFDGSGLQPAEPIPDWLSPCCRRAEEAAGLAPGAIEQALLIRYPVGAGLGWHRDRPVFGEVIGLSLASPAPLRFRRKVDDKWQRFTLEAERRSLYRLSGEARHAWQHGLAPVAALRYAITLRTLARRAKDHPGDQL